MALVAVLPEPVTRIEARYQPEEAASQSGGVELPQYFGGKSGDSNQVSSNVQSVHTSIAALATIRSSTPSERVRLSEEYGTFRLASFISELSQNLSIWAKHGTDGALDKVSAIRDLLDRNAKYLEASSQGETLLSLLELIFQNNNWDEFTSGKIMLFKNEVEKFNDGKITEPKLDKFMQQLYLAGINPLRAA